MFVSLMLSITAKSYIIGLHIKGTKSGLCSLQSNNTRNVKMNRTRLRSSHAVASRIFAIFLLISFTFCIILFTLVLFHNTYRHLFNFYYYCFLLAVVLKLNCQKVHISYIYMLLF